MNRIIEIRYYRGILSFPGTPRCKYFLSIQEAPRRSKGRKNNAGENVFFYSDVSKYAKKSGTRRRMIRLEQLKNWNPRVILRTDQSYLVTLYLKMPYKNALGDRAVDSAKFAFRLTEPEAKRIQASFPPLHKRVKQPRQIQAAVSAGELPILELEASIVPEMPKYYTFGERKLIELRAMIRTHLVPLFH